LLRTDSASGEEIIMRNAAILLIVVALAALGVILFSQASNISRQSETSNPKAILSSPAEAAAPGRASATTPVTTTIEPVSGSISWERSLAQATETAKAENKVIVVDVYTDWCGWCKRMDQDIYSNPKIVGLSRQQVFLKLDAEDGGQGESFAGKMNVKGYPTTIILDSDGKRIAEKRGFIPSPDQFIQFVEGARARREG
jgi:thiol:disulfide interchange protein